MERCIGTAMATYRNTGHLHHRDMRTELLNLKISLGHGNLTKLHHSMQKRLANIKSYTTNYKTLIISFTNRMEVLSKAVTNLLKQLLPTTVPIPIIQTTAMWCQPHVLSYHHPDQTPLGYAANGGLLETWSDEASVEPKVRTKKQCDTTSTYSIS